MSEKELNPIEEYAGFYVPHWLKVKSPTFHREMYHVAYRGDKRIVIIAPRAFAKSTVFSKIYPLYKICEGVVGKILLVSETLSLAKRWLRDIKREIESNDAIISDFGVKKSIKWTEDLIIVKLPDGKEVEVQAIGQGGQSRGLRPDIVILDDMESDEGVRSDDQRYKLLDWYNKSLVNTLEPNSQLIMIGTLLHPLALLLDVANRKGYTSLKYQAITPEGKSLWPEKWPIEALLERKEEIGVLAFNSEFQGDPLITENPIFWRDWFREYDSDDDAFIKEIARGVHTVMAIDPAISRKEGSDYTAIVAVSATFGDKPKFYVRRPIRGRWTIHEQVCKLIDYHDKYKCDKVLIETVAYQEALEQEVNRICEESKKFINVRSIKPDRDKERRAHNVASMIQAGQVYFDKEDIITMRMLDELMVFPTGNHDDLVDVLVYCLSDLKDWQSRPRSEQSGPYVVLPGNKKRNCWTGVA